MNKLLGIKLLSTDEVGAKGRAASDVFRLQMTYKLNTLLDMADARF